MYVDLNPPGADFYPLPEGATEYKDEYKTLTKTYTGKAGEEITVRFTVNNQGEEGVTNVAATWFGKGWGRPLMHEKGITLKKGESRDFSLAGHHTQKLFSRLPFHFLFHIM